MNTTPMHSTTVLFVRKKGKAVMVSDGQVTLGHAVVKRQARKVRKMYEDKVLAGFAGSAADSMTLFERFESRLNEFSGDLTRAAVELAKDWRLDKVLRRLESIIIVADKSKCFLISGGGDVIEPDDEVVAIGSGGNYAYAAARALHEHTDLAAKTIATEAMNLAAEICIYTNTHLTIEEIK